MWSQVFRFIAKEANAFANRHPEACRKSGVAGEDFIQEGYLAMMACVWRFAPDKGAKFLTLLGFYLRSRFQGMVGWHSRREPMNEAVSIHAPLTDELALEDTLADPAADMEEAENRIYLEELREALNASMAERNDSAQREVLKRRYYWGQTYGEIAREMGRSVSTISAMECQALQRLAMAPRLREYRREVLIAQMAHRGSLKVWLNTGSSAVERTVLALERNL